MEDTKRKTELEQEALQAINPYKTIYSQRMIRLGYIGLLGLILFTIVVIYQTIRSFLLMLEFPWIFLFLVIDLLALYTCCAGIYMLIYFVTSTRLVTVLSANIQAGTDTILKLSNDGIVSSTGKYYPFDQVVKGVESKNLYVLFLKINKNNRIVTTLIICPKEPDLDFNPIAEKHGITILNGFHQDNI